MSLTKLYIKGIKTEYSDSRLVVYRYGNSKNFRNKG